MASINPPSWQSANSQGQSFEKIEHPSGFIESADYNATTLTMTINFKNGAQSQLFFVYPAEWEAYKMAPSKGSFFNKALRGKKMGAKTLHAGVGHKKKGE